MSTSGPGPHHFHGKCINGAHNFYALTKEVGGDVEIRRMAVWPSAAGIAHPFPPFRNPNDPALSPVLASRTPECLQEDHLTTRQEEGP